MGSSESRAASTQPQKDAIARIAPDLRTDRRAGQREHGDAHQGENQPPVLEEVRCREEHARYEWQFGAEAMEEVLELRQYVDGQHDHGDG